MGLGGAHVTYFCEKMVCQAVTLAKHQIPKLNGPSPLVSPEDLVASRLTRDRTLVVTETRSLPYLT